MTPVRQTDWLTFTISTGLVLITCGTLISAPEAGARLLPAIYDRVATTFGPAFLLAGLSTLIFLIWLACSRYGAVRLGGDGTRPEFGIISWAAMLFCAGIGAGLMYWAAIEWTYYLDTPPFGIEPGTPAAEEWAATYGLFHWGPTAWAFYCLPALAIGISYHNRGARHLRLSTGCMGVPGFNPEQPLGRLVDLVFMISLLGGAGSSLGFSTPMIAALIARIFGLENGFYLEVSVLVVTIGLFGLSAALGLRKGIARLSDINIGLILVLLAFILLAGPTVQLLEAGLTGYGLMAQNFIRMNTWAEPFGDTNFVIDWTIFYWAWWVAYGPVVGLFVARVSRGRTIREIIFGMIGYGSLGAGLFFVILGNYGLSLELDGTAQIADLVTDDGGALAIVAMLDQLPLPVIVMTVFAVTAIIFSATTYDSASYILASNVTSNLEAGRDPSLWQRLFWAAMLGALPITLLFVGGLRVVQTAALIASAPVLLIGIVMVRSLLRHLAEETGETGQAGSAPSSTTSTSRTGD